MNLVEQLENPAFLCTREMVLGSPCPVPSTRGLYGWFFKEIPGHVPVDGCLRHDDLTLLYVGISPRNERSRHLRSRITYHYRGNAEGSTLRLTLGVLLTKVTNFPLRVLYPENECIPAHPLIKPLFSKVSEGHALPCPNPAAPWEIEPEIVRALALPLNIEHNAHHPFSTQLSEIRASARMIARLEEIAREDNQRRRRLGVMIA